MFNAANNAIKALVFDHDTPIVAFDRDDSLVATYCEGSNMFGVWSIDRDGECHLIKHVPGGDGLDSFTDVMIRAQRVLRQVAPAMYVD